MDVGTSGSIDTYSIIENGNYSFAEISCKDALAGSSDEFIELRDKFATFKTRPLIWADLNNADFDLREFEADKGFVKNHLIDLFSRIDRLRGEYVIINHSPEIMKTDSEKYICLLNDIATLAGSYGLEIILLAEGDDEERTKKNYETMKLLGIDHPFLHFGLDVTSVENINDFFDSLSDIDNVLYYRISAQKEGFKESFLDMVNKFADTDVHLCVWSNIGEIAGILTTDFIAEL